VAHSEIATWINTEVVTVGDRYRCRRCFLMTLPLLAVRGMTAVAERTPYEGPASSYFVEPHGYSYREMPQGAVDAARQQLVSDPKVRDAIADLDVREATIDGTARGGVAIIVLDAPPDTWDEEE